MDYRIVRCDCNLYYGEGDCGQDMWSDTAQTMTITKAIRIYNDLKTIHPETDFRVEGIADGRLAE